MEGNRKLTFAIALVITVLLALVIIQYGSEPEPVDDYFTELTVTDKELTVDGEQFKVYTSTYVNPYMPTSEIPFYYSDGLFASDPKEFNYHLVTTTLLMSSTGFVPKGSAPEDQSEVARQYMEMLGCEDFHVNDDFKKTPTENSIGVAMATKKITLGGEEKIVIPLLMRSGNYGLEWVSNFTLGTSGEAEGFSEASEKVLAELESYMADHSIDPESDDVLFWITGYSRGAATANLLAKKVVDAYDKIGSRTYCYTYETPSGGIESEEKEDSDYTCIHNVYDKRDLVTLVAPKNMGFIHYGVDHFLPGLEAGEITSLTEDITGASDVTTVTQSYDNFDGFELGEYPQQDDYEDILWDMFGFEDHPEFHPKILTVSGDYEEVEEKTDLRGWLWDFISDFQNWTETDREKYAGGEGVNLEQCLRSLLRELNQDNTDKLAKPFTAAFVEIAALDPSISKSDLDILVKDMEDLVDTEALKVFGMSSEETEFLIDFILELAYYDMCQTTLERGIVGFEYLGTLFGSTMELVGYHMPQYCLAWAMAFDDFYAE